MGPEGAGWELIQTMSRENARANALDDDLIRTPDPPGIDRLEEITAPTLVITAGRDVADMGRIGRMLASRIPGARHVEIEGADHAVNLRQPEEFNRVVLDFLSEVGAGTA